MRKHIRFARLLAGVLSLSLLAGSSLALAAEGDASVGYATYWEGTLFIEGNAAYFSQGEAHYEPINYNGNIYVPLYALYEWMTATTQWNPAQKQITVHTYSSRPTFYRTAGDMPSWGEEWLQVLEDGRAEGFSVTLLSDTTVTGAYGEVTTVTPEGNTLCPIVYEGVPYLSVRTVAQLSGKTLCYFADLPMGPGGAIYLYAPPSQEQLQNARLYLTELDARIDAFAAASDALAQADTLEALHSGLVEVRDRLLSIKDLSLPSIPTLAEEILSYLHYYGIDGEKGLQKLEPDIFYTATPGAWTSDPRYRSSQDYADYARSSAKVFHTLADNLTVISAQMWQITEGMAQGRLR